jgi:hypothetical protein
VLLSALSDLACCREIAAVDRMDKAAEIAPTIDASAVPR